jgi:hypothetical protein
MPEAQAPPLMILLANAILQEHNGERWLSRPVAL